MGNEPRRPATASDPQSVGARLARSRAKREIFTRLLLENGSVGIRLDARRNGVVVPSSLERDTSLALDIWWQPPDAPMRLNERGIAATLRFEGESFRCLIPWTAIWAIREERSGTLQSWEADLPVELGGLPVPPDLVEEPIEPRPRLVHSVPAREVTLPPAAAKPAPEEPTPPKPPHLRLVK